MTILARIIFSFQAWLKNPVEWFAKRHWLVRWLLVLLLIPFISVSTLVLADKLPGQNGDGATTTLSSELHDRLTKLEKEAEAHHESELNELKKLQNDVLVIRSTLRQQSSADVLGAEDDLGSEAASGSSNIIFVPSQFETVTVYEKPSTDSEPVILIAGDNLYFYTQKEGEWYLVDLDSEYTGWIQAQYVVPLP